jgi:hypothetical protein
MAIAFDTATDGGFIASPGPLTWSHTCSGTNRILWVGCFGNFGGGSGLISGVTYAGVAMTQIATALVSGDRWIYLFCLEGTALGANNIVVSGTADFMGGAAASYNSAAQAGQPDATAHSSPGPNTALTQSVTTVAANCWAILVVRSSGGGTAAGSGTTLREFGASGIFIGDNNGPVSAATTVNMTVTFTSGSSAAIIASFAPFLVTKSRSIIMSGNRARDHLMIHPRI